MSFMTKFANAEAQRPTQGYTWAPFAESRFGGLRTVAAAGAILTTIALVASNLYFLSFFHSWDEGALVPVDLENGLFEMSQLALLAAAMVVFALSWRWGTGAVKAAGGLLAMLSLAAVVRESELESLGVHFGVLGVSEGNLPEVLLALIAIAMIGYLLVNRRSILDLVALALNPRCWPIHAAGLLIVFSLLLDGWLSTGRETRYWEELGEFNAYALLLIGAWRHIALVGAVSSDAKRARAAADV